MNYKSYKFLKYLATLSSVIFSIAILIAFIQQTRTDKLFTSLTAFITLEIILIVLGIISFITYLIIRLKLRNKTEYQNTKKDNIYLITSFILYIVVIVLVISYFLISLTVNNQNILKILFYVFMPLSVILAIIASISETLSRLNEQLLLYKKEYQRIQAQENKKQAKIVKKKASDQSQVSLDDPNNPFND
ncbi:Uncharacterised protein [Mycoplasma putrefaciens]|uniref:Transmembrane protein n=1 Tax=Mycoplasma putrefaciens (strain ATCC 15718 / NCTC 10155 / C30 KS-1 / KS-1) TaxID=743965 RepID=A0A7U3ZSR0_MYCPK|nr:MFS transporter [Mycoplasma putrefaciens]AEM68833.1 uncharacterized protein MPUT_0461 [Mycoplasma putrefaciens KS1]SYV96150.1 Uncharacterised protein [Mycoplasma putrefaciens]